MIQQRRHFVVTGEAGAHNSVRPWLPRQLHPLVPPQVSHLRQVPLRTRVKLPHSVQLSPSTLSPAS